MPAVLVSPGTPVPEAVEVEAPEVPEVPDAPEVEALAVPKVPDDTKAKEALDFLMNFFTTALYFSFA